MENPIKMDDLGEHHFRKHPYITMLTVMAANLCGWTCLAYSVCGVKAGHMPGEAEIIDFATSSDAFHEGRSRCPTLWLLSCLVFSSCRIQLHFASLSSFGLCTTPLAIAEAKWWTC